MTLKKIKSARFIPFRKTDILAMCLSQGSLTNNNKTEFETVYSLIQSILHFEFHSELNKLKNSYASLDPDADTHSINANDITNATVIDLLDNILNKANYEKIPQSELEQALTEQSLFKIRLQVNFNDYSEVLLYCRGEKTKTEVIQRVFGYCNKSLTFINYDRVVICLKQKDTTQSNLLFLKLFKNVPKADLEMLFPNTKIRMRNVDKLMIGVPAALSGAIIIATKLGATVVLLGSLIGYWLGLSATEIEIDKTKLLILFAGIGTVAGYLWKQLSVFKNKKLRFMKVLTENLYFKNLDNNAGVFHRLVDEAEEEECKEVILAYYFLLISEKGLSQEALDTVIEQWFQQQWHCDVDFEIEDALAKLLEYKLIVKQNKIFIAIDSKKAIAVLNKRWVNYFDLTDKPAKNNIGVT